MQGEMGGSKELGGCNQNIVNKKSIFNKQKNRKKIFDDILTKL